MSGLLCCLKALTLCGFRDCLVNQSAFRPPKQRVYQLKLERNDLVKGNIYKMVMKDQEDNSYEAEEASDTNSYVVMLETKTRTKIPAVFIENKNCKSNYVILYSHGNSTDIGRMLTSLQDLSQALNIHVFAYEYSGYGVAQGSPSEIEVIFGIIAAYEYLIERLGFQWRQIILYGRSIGSGPSIFLASHPDYPVTGVILHAPLASGYTLLKPNMKTADKRDLFPNYEFIEHVSAHVFIMHGEADADIPVAHGKLLESRCKNPYNAWWVQDATHNDIDYNHQRAYLLRISKFLRHIRDFNFQQSSEEREQFYRVLPWSHTSGHMYFKQMAKVEEQHKRFVAQNGKKVLRDQSYMSESMDSTKNIQGRTIEDDKPTLDGEGNESRQQEDLDDLVRIERVASRRASYLPPHLPSRTHSIRLKTTAAEVEFSSVSYTSQSKELHDITVDVGAKDLRSRSESAFVKGYSSGSINLNPTSLFSENANGSKFKFEVK